MYADNGRATPFIPNELLVQILRKVSPKDIHNVRVLNRQFNNIVRGHYKYLPRMEHSVTVYSQSGDLFIEHKRNGYLGHDVQLLNEFDYYHWESLEICSLEFKNIEFGIKDGKQCAALEELCEQLMMTQQKYINCLAFNSMNLNGNYISFLRNLFKNILDNCKQLLFRDCVLPTSLTEDVISRMSVDHYRWLNCNTADRSSMSDSVIRKFCLDMRNSQTKKSFMAEVNEMDVGVVCDFLETWLRSPNPSFFNFSLHDCDDRWKQAFLSECQQRNLSHYCLEFASKTHNNAHIKVNFVEDSRMCRIWPIFDVPARSAGQLICYARYFRDF